MALALLDLGLNRDTTGWLIHTGPTGPAAAVMHADFPREPQFDRGEHDGPMFYVVAKYPFDLQEASRSLDRPQYRLQRPLFPWLARALYPPGTGVGLVWAMFLIGAASVVVGSLSLGALSVTLGGTPMLALAVGIMPGSIMSLRISAADSLSLALLLAALALSLRGFGWQAVLVAIAAVFAKETALLTLVGFSLWRRDRWGAALVGVPFATAALWALYLRHAVPVGEGSLIDITGPFQGLHDAAVLWLRGENLLALMCVPLAIGLGVAGIVLAGWKHPLTIPVALNLPLLVIFNLDVVGLDRNGTRTVLPLLSLAIVVVATARSARLGSHQDSALAEA